MLKVFKEYKVYNGETGASNVLTIGTVESGEEASADITGTSPNQVLNLVLPKGDKGNTGEKGEKGDKGDTGEKGATGENGYTPVKGVDYWTNEDKQEIVEDVEEEINPTIEALQTQVQELENNQLTGEESGQSIYLSDSADSRVRSIGLSGNSEQESTTGKQLFDKDSENIVRNKYLQASGNTANSNDFSISDYIPASENTNYTIQPHRSLSACVCFYNESKAFISSVTLDSVNPNLTTPSDCKYIRSSFRNADIDIFMLNEGSTAEPWEKYTGGQAAPSPIYPFKIHSTGDSGSVNEKVQNKNLWSADLPLLFKHDGENNIIPNENGGIDIKLNAGQARGYAYYDLGKISDYKGKTLTFSIGNEPSSLYKWCSFINCDATASSHRIEIANMGSSNNQLAITIGDNYTETNLAVRLYIEGGTPNTTYSINHIQVEENPTATDYVAHEEQDISFPLAQGQKLMQGDYLADDGIHHVREEIVLDGSNDEGWTRSGTNTSNQYRFSSSIIANTVKKPSSGSDVADVLCSHFIKESADQTYSKNNGIAIHPNGNIFIFDDSFKEYTIEEFKAVLSQNPITLQYPLAEEVIDPYTEEQQAVWEQIKALRTYKPVTHISSTDEVPATVNVTYVKDLETVINNLGGA